MNDSWRQGQLGSSVDHLASVLGQHGAGNAARDVALDLMLNEIVEQACLATNATGAAIALGHDGELICRATTGGNAPDLGIRLHAGSGLSGLCIQTREVQHCDDPATDSRVDLEVCRQLGVESVLVVPILKDGELLGIFEIFSSLPYSFGERDVQTLLALSQRIVNAIRPARRSEIPPSPIPPKVAEFLSPLLAEDAPPADAPELFQSSMMGQRRDYWTPLLTVTVITLSLLLGWMLGRTGWQSARKTAGAGAGAVSAPPGAGTGNPSPSTDTPSNAAASSATSPAPSPGRVQPNGPPSGGLVVYEAGKLVFQMKPSPQHPGVEMAADRSVASGKVIQRPSAAALENLIQRVEPHYPDQARREHIQGSVVLMTRVGKDGSVQKLQALSGHPLLVMAAADAVRQWRFKPYAPKGEPVEFETQIPVNFNLP